MVPFRPTSQQAQAQIHFIFALFFNVVLAALQNVTVDDAVLTGPVVPQYLPNDDTWNVGNNCTGCLAQPDPARAYNGTWHDSTFSVGTGVLQEIQFSFTGNAVYVFFILANTIPYATTTTDLTFILDNVNVSTYTHNPDTTSDYMYNVPVYANASLDFGVHSVSIQPSNSGLPTLMLFDYLIYTTNMSTTPSQTATSLSSSPPSSGAYPATSSSGLNVSAIVGGTVGGVAAVSLVIAFLLCRRRYKRRNGNQQPEVAEPFVLSREAGLSSAEPVSRSKSGRGTSMHTSSGNPQPVPSGNDASSTPYGASSGSSDNADLLEEVELLRNEVARLRYLRVPDLSATPSLLESEAPPEYWSNSSQAAIHVV